MEEFWILILVAFFATNALDKAEAVKVKQELKTFDEIFGEGWWDKGETEDLKTPAPTNFGQNVHRQIDRQNTQIGQIEPNPPLTESDHSDNDENEQKQIDKTVAKELGLSLATIYKWKRELGQTEPNQKFSHSEQKEMMKRYYEIKGKNPKISDENIAKMFKIGGKTLVRWKKQFSVDGHFVEENVAANVQEIGNSNLKSF
uniref:Transposase n=1 Tax=Globodera rostochiensis TaxID=31243 RepID=A0A914H1E2_GLORO